MSTTTKISNDPALERMWTMRQQGYGDAEIGRAFNISRQRVHQVLGKSNVDRRKRVRITFSDSTATPKPLGKKIDRVLSTALSQWRIRHGFTQKQAIQILHLSAVRVYSTWENGIACTQPGLVLDFLKLWEAQQQAPQTRLRHIYGNLPLHEALLLWRKNNNLTQAQAAVILHLASVVSYSKWERGLGCRLPGLVVDFIKLWEAHKNILT